MAKKRKRKRKGDKHRVEFRKNRENRARDNDLTRAHERDDESIADARTGERLSGKGDVTRRRTVVAETAQDDDDRLVRDVDLENCRAGRVVSAVGLTSLVENEDGARYECTVRRVVRTMSRDARNAVVAGDVVQFQPTGHEVEGVLEGVVERVEPRRSVVSRRSGRREHVIVANVDQAVIVATADDPPLKPRLIDRFLISARKGGVRPVVCINKCDLVDLSDLQPILGRYARLGCEVVAASATGDDSGERVGIERLRSLLNGRETVFTGQSGVGKSSLLNALDPELELRTTEVSDWSGKGRHTTRRAILMHLSTGGWVVDTPGIRELDLWDVPPEEVEAYFIEFRPFVPQCRFPDCTHTHESDCGVKRAVACDMISPHRYESYVRIVESDA